MKNDIVFITAWSPAGELIRRINVLPDYGRCGAYKGIDMGKRVLIHYYE